MPTQSLTSALLVLTAGTKGLPWKSSAWEALTNVHGVPWDTEDSASDDSHSKINPEWMVHIAKSVKAFVANVSKKPTEDEQNKYVTSHQANNDSEGRLVWVQWVSRAQKSWGLNTIIDEVITAQGSAPREVLKLFEMKTVCLFYSATCSN